MMEEEKPKKKQKKKVEATDSTFDKDREKLKKFDARGVQTLFRTVSRNHYNLLRMVDSKSSIILTINSIIISLLMGALYIIPETNREIMVLVARILINFSLASMIFAVLAMLPHKYLGKKYKKSGYKGNLYASNFADHSLKEFQTEFQRIMTNGNTIYDEMVMDIYFLGKVINRKQRMLIVSVFIFLFGLIAAFLTTALGGFVMPI